MTFIDIKANGGIIVKDKRNQSSNSSIFLRGQKVPSYNFADMKKSAKDNNNDFSKLDLRKPKK